MMALGDHKLVKPIRELINGALHDANVKFNEAEKIMRTEYRSNHLELTIKAYKDLAAKLLAISKDLEDTAAHI